MSIRITLGIVAWMFTQLFWSGRLVGCNAGIQGGEGNDAWYRKAASSEGILSLRIMLWKANCRPQGKWFIGNSFQNTTSLMCGSFSRLHDLFQIDTARQYDWFLISSFQAQHYWFLTDSFAGQHDWRGESKKRGSRTDDFWTEDQSSQWPGLSAFYFILS